MQLFMRASNAGKEQMVGMNAKTEPVGVVRAIFDLLDHFRHRTDSPVIAIGVLGAMNIGHDLSQYLWNSFVAEHQTALGRVPTSEYKGEQESIRLGHGKRDMPPQKERPGRSELAGGIVGTVQRGALASVVLDHPVRDGASWMDRGGHR
jgi:hypothetical protein